MYLRLHCSFILTGFLKQNKNRIWHSQNCVPSVKRTKEYSNKKREQHGRRGCLSSILSGSHYRTVQCKNDPKTSHLFPSWGPCHASTRWHHHTADASALLHRHIHLGDDSFRSERRAPLGPTWPPTPTFKVKSGLWGGSRFAGFKVAEPCFVKCVFMLHQVCQLPMPQGSEDPSLICLNLSVFFVFFVQFFSVQWPAEAWGRRESRWVLCVLEPDCSQ